MNNYTKIDNYLWGKLSPEEKDTFEKEIDSDVSLAEEVEFHKLEIQAMELLFLESIESDGQNKTPEREESLRAKMKVWEKDLRSKGGKPGAKNFQFMSSRLLAIASSILLLVSVSTWSYVNVLKPNRMVSNGLSFEPLDQSGLKSIEYLRSSANNYKQNYALAGELLSRKEYEEARVIFLELRDTALDDQAISEGAAYYLGLCDIGQRKYGDAKRVFKKIVVAPNHRYRISAGKMLEVLR